MIHSFGMMTMVMIMIWENRGPGIRCKNESEAQGSATNADIDMWLVSLERYLPCIHTK